MRINQFSKWAPVLFIIFAIFFAAGCSRQQTVNEGSSDSVPKGEIIEVEALASLVEHTIALENGESFSLNAPDDLSIIPASQGMGRIRFMDVSPDGRLFVPDMINLSDNSNGKIYALEDFDASTGRFGSRTEYLTNLRNPNSLAFYTDEAGQDWLYIALTDSLMRYKYEDGDMAPSGESETITTFPDYGLSYKYGGWHLTRTIEFGDNGKLYISSGSSCNVCEEKDDEKDNRAVIIEINPDGSEERVYAEGLRNAVGLEWAKNSLFATDMGSDHLGDDMPIEKFVEVKDGKNYGWPYCYQADGEIFTDTNELLDGAERRIDCDIVPVSEAEFPSHAAPLGLEYFDKKTKLTGLKDSFLVALHGSSDRSLGRGYSIVRVDRDNQVNDYITGFMVDGYRYGRPVDMIKLTDDQFFFTDDFAGVVYYVSSCADECKNPF